MLPLSSYSYMGNDTPFCRVEKKIMAPLRKQLIDQESRNKFCVMNSSFKIIVPTNKQMYKRYIMTLPLPILLC